MIFISMLADSLAGNLRSVSCWWIEVNKDTTEWKGVLTSGLPVVDQCSDSLVNVQGHLPGWLWQQLSTNSWGWLSKVIKVHITNSRFATGR